MKSNSDVIIDRFWSRMQEISRKEGIPYQWKALNDEIPDSEPSHCIKNFRIAAGKEQGEHWGWAFQDSDVAKWLEAVAYSLMWHPDAELEKTADKAIDIVIDAQQPDGYLGTYYTIKGLDKRWTNLKDHHEMYIAGHMIEAAVAYYQATGKRKFLDACLKLVDHIDGLFGPEEDKQKGYPGHPVLEMALMRLYEITNDEKHLKLAKYFIDQRGQSPLYFQEETKKYQNTFPWQDSLFQYQYYQAGKPVREQKKAEGHAVRALYLYSGMADVAHATNDEELQKACETLWRNVTRRQMYVTGAVGAAEYGESFTYDYDLPNDTVYGESCASIALVFLALRMLRHRVDGEYADVMERALYNGVISGMQLDGKRFFYVNPLEVLPEACEKDHGKRHVKPERQKWFGCACCPPNIIRLLTSLSQYVSFSQKNTAYLHLYIGSEKTLSLDQGVLKLKVEADYPKTGLVNISLKPQFEGISTFAVRIPGYCRKYRLLAKGQPVSYVLKNGYAYIEYSGETQITLEMKIENRLVQASPLVRENLGKGCVMRGPMVYCLEEIDNGKRLHLLSVNKDTEYEERYEPETLGGIMALYCKGKRINTDYWEQKDCLYADLAPAIQEETEIKWIPYYAWSNRGIGEMCVWVKIDN